jgi:hypothetical protein
MENLIVDKMTAFSVAQQPNLSLGRLTVKVYGSHTIINTHLVWLPQMSDQLFAEAATYTTPNKCDKHPCPSLEFGPTIPAIKQLKTYTLHHIAPIINKWGIIWDIWKSKWTVNFCIFKVWYKKIHYYSI